jgi:DNA-binding NarL/FixJ family response regulator
LVKVLVASDVANVTDNISTAHINGSEVLVEHVSDWHQAERRLRLDGRDLDAVIIHLSDLSEHGLRSAFSTIVQANGKPVAVMLPKDASMNIVSRCLINGAGAVLTEDMEPVDVGHILSLMRSGLKVATLNDAVIPDPTRVANRLSDRELQVLAGVCKGLQNKEIAHDFNIKEVTVKMHVRAVIRKLEAKNRTHAAMIARNLGLVS